MSYTALRKMEEENRERYGMYVGPKQPDIPETDDPDGLKFHVMHFIHDLCEGLNFNEEVERIEQQTGSCLGTSTRPEQIPYNMEMDINRLCLEVELSRFIDSGTAEDAYTIYYCYLEMFFGNYGKSKKMVELLSEFESNGSSLLMKHRDHYSHSVYVFCLGLAFYHSNTLYREQFNRFYGFGPDQVHEAANFFLRYWGMTSLFHDIGYPFELPFEQVMSYFEVDNQSRGIGVPYLAYRNMAPLTRLPLSARLRFSGIYRKRIVNTNDLFSAAIVDRLGSAYDISDSAMSRMLKRKPTAPDQFNYYMDHAYFSANRLFRQMLTTAGTDSIEKVHLDALSAILLHNSLYKFDIVYYKSSDRRPPIRVEQHPLAYMLMLCDELQCWDRTAYGRNSRNELHPMAANFDFTDTSVTVTYFFDIEEKEKIDNYEEALRKWEENGKPGKPPKLKAYSDMASENNSFSDDLSRIVDPSQIPVKVRTSLCENDRTSKHTYLSRSNFLHLYDFAVALNARYSYQGREKEIPESVLESDFEALSLEYQLSNINQAKSFGKYLDAIGCFYTDQPVDYDIITAFDSGMTEIFAPMEHMRWVIDHIMKGWSSGNLYETIDDTRDRRALREQFRMHKLTMDGDPTEEEIMLQYYLLPPEEQEKDYKPFNSMLELIKKYDGLRIYKLT